MNSELLTMDAGEALDFEIAKLLGWRVFSWGLNGGVELGPNREVLYQWLYVDTAPHPIPEYSTDLNTAWALVQTITTLQVSVDNANCVALIIPLGGLPIFGDAPRDKPALAVCRAWIQWKQQEGGAK